MNRLHMPSIEAPARSVDEPHQAAVRDALRALPQLDRQLIALQFGAGLTLAEIAQALALPHHYIHQRLSASVTCLRERIRRDGIAAPVSDACMERAVTSGFLAPGGLHEKVRRQLAALRASEPLRCNVTLVSRFTLLLTAYFAATAQL